MSYEQFILIPSVLHSLILNHEFLNDTKLKLNFPGSYCNQNYAQGLMKGKYFDYVQKEILLYLAQEVNMQQDNHS